MSGDFSDKDKTQNEADDDYMKDEQLTDGESEADAKKIGDLVAGSVNKAKHAICIKDHSYSRFEWTLEPDSTLFHRPNIHKLMQELQG